MAKLTPEQKEIIEKVQKLLALSKSENEHEAALALARAESLLEKYRLDMTQVEMMTGHKEEIIEDEEPIFDSEKIALWESKLVVGIAFNYGCSTIRLQDKIIKIIGRASDIMFVRYFVSYITLELFRLSANVFYKKRKDWKDSWFMGAVAVILDRMKEAKRNEQTQCANQFAVVTINNRFEESFNKLKELYKNIGHGSPDKPKKFNQDAYESGRVAGHQVKIRHDESVSAKSTLNML